MRLPPLVGRQHHQRRLRAAAAPGALLLLAGPAGSGKTRLVHTLTEDADTTVLTGHCPPRAEPFPFAALVDALRQATIPDGLSPLCGALAPLIPEHTAHLPPAPPPAPTPAADHHRTYRALAELLDALGPAVLVLEDTQWIDAATHDLLRYLTPRLPPHLSLILTYRPEELPRSVRLAALAARTPPGTRHDELTLGPLTAEDVHTLAEHILHPRPVTRADAHRLRDWTGGLPLAVTQTLHHLAATAPTTPAADPLIPTRPPVPAPLRDWLLDRVRSLGRDARRLVHAASVLEGPAHETHLAHIGALPPERADKALSQACRRAVLTTTAPATLTLATPLLHQVCHDHLRQDRRRRLHRAALEVLARTEDPPHARLARHARESGDHDRWTEHAARAAEQALAAGEDATAVALLRDALTRPDLPAPRRRDLALTLGRAALTGLSADHTITVLRDVLTTPGMSAAERGELRMELGLLLLNQAARGRTARGELVRAATELSTRPDLAARAMCALAVPRSTPDPVDTHRRWMDQAVTAARRSRNPATPQVVAVNQATLLAQIGDPAAWDVPLPDPGTAHGHPTPDVLARRREFARGSLNLADAAVMLGHYDRADHHLDDAAHWSPPDQTPYVHASAHTLRLMLDWARGRWSGLAERTERDLRSPRLARLHAVTAELTLVRAALALAQGDPATTQARLADLCAGAGADDAPDYTVPVRAFAAGLAARLATAQGDPAAAWHHVQDLVTLVANKGVWVWAADLLPGLCALIACGRRAVARDLCTRFSAGLRGTDAPAAHTALLRLEAALAHDQSDHDRALALYRKAEDRYLDMPRPYDAAQVREEGALAHLARPGGRGTAAGLTALHAALEQYTALGAAWDAARVRRALRSHGVHTVTGTGRGRRGTRLSPREGEIAALAAQGRTNREIAALLHLSPRTVETHVANALGKLGLRSRRELTAPTDTAPT
ncbi:LuxR family transcriptional regulator [Nocardiopsis sp. YSL2]|uniref:helix-turn-helix transcriptional regulator n=1 Tax=Nocardiopsis sp. YSL2 TaxID=2939492 RepID=UPI0026F41971|nr:AAA family ATPase [Nocardiopsis sp. YSL2]